MSGCSSQLWIVRMESDTGEKCRRKEDAWGFDNFLSEQTSLGHLDMHNTQYTCQNETHARTSHEI